MALPDVFVTVIVDETRKLLVPKFRVTVAWYSAVRLMLVALTVPGTRPSGAGAATPPAGIAALRDAPDGDGDAAAVNRAVGVVDASDELDPVAAVELDPASGVVAAEVDAAAGCSAKPAMPTTAAATTNNAPATSRRSGVGRAANRVVIESC
jgi:hypothetical protein